MPSTVETEARFRIPCGAMSADRLGRWRARSVEKMTIVDVWYAPTSVTDYATHESWLAGGGAPLRIREQVTENRSRLSIEVKRPVAPQNYTHSVEAKIPLESVPQGEAFANALGYHPIATLKKSRRLWRIDDVAVALDQYENGVEILELEVVSGDGAGIAPDRLHELARKLGVPSSAAIDGSSALLLIREQFTRHEQGGA